MQLMPVTRHALEVANIYCRKKMWTPGLSISGGFWIVSMAI